VFTTTIEDERAMANEEILVEHLFQGENEVTRY